MSGLASSAARGSAVTIASQGIKLVLMLASTIVLARLLSPSDYGIIAMVVAIVGVGEIFRDFGLSMSALRAKELSQQQQSNLLWINVGVGAILTILFFFLAVPISLFYGRPELVGIVHVLSMTFVVNGISTQFRVRINRELRFVALAVADIVPYALAFAAALGLALYQGTYWALVAQQLVVSVAGLALAVIFARWMPGLPGRAEMGGLIKFGMSFAATQLVSYATRNVDSIAIGRVWGAASLGMYDRAYQLLVMPLTQINTPLSRVAIPVLSRISDEQEKFVRYLRQAQLIALYVTASLFTVVAAIGEQIVVWVLGAQWQEAGQILQVLAIGGIFRAVVQISYWIYMAKGMAKQQFWFYLVAQPAVVVVMLAGLPWGAMGVAIGHSVGYGLFWIASLLWVGRQAKINVRPFFGDALRAIGTFGAPAAILAFAASTVLESAGPMARVFGGIGAAAIWYLVAWVIFPRVRADIRVLTQFMRLALGRRRA
ncbi:lipopolysaccharide biosynthesis protein [Agreia sp. Leaf244]|uniref:lipopolysaccharide biosynthesis protein n=1 Tax=Agreia sp. Leaf244 TaxID=1736305 RepID=UPI0009E6DF65|nr:lipopolysaccharide biosynthesis protein [Agreia sp. Leaf244]